MFGLFKKKEMTEEEALKKIDEMKAAIKKSKQENQKKEQHERNLVINEIKRLLCETDDDILDAVFNQAAYIYLVNGLDDKMSLLYKKPILGFSEQNLFSSTIKYMFDLYLNWKKEYNIFLNKCVMEAIRQIRKERKKNKDELSEDKVSC